MTISARSRYQEFHGHQGATLNPRFYFVIDTAFLMNGLDDRTSSGRIQNGYRLGGQVLLYTLFEVEGELGGVQVGWHASLGVLGVSPHFSFKSPP
jgi:hypothetical protein